MKLLKNKIFRRLALLVSMIVLLTSTVNTTFGFIVTKTDSLINTFVPFDNIISNLLISKNVEHPFGDEYVIPDNIAFDFKIDFGSLYANTTIKTTTGDIVADCAKIAQATGNQLNKTEINFYTKEIHEKVLWGKQLKAYLDTAIVSDAIKLPFSPFAIICSPSLIRPLLCVIS